MSTQSKQSKHTFPRIAGRFLAGRDLDGQRRTNATFLRHADRDLTAHGRASRWAHRRGWERAAWRTGGLLSAVGVLYGLAVARTVTLAALTACVVPGLALATWRITQLARNWTHNQRIVSPLYKTLAPIAGHPPSDNHTRYLTVPRNFDSDDTAKIRLMLSPLWEGTITQQKAITGLVSRRLNLDLEAKWYHHAIPPHAEFVRAPSPPGKITYAEFKPYMDKSPAHIIPMGFGTGRSLITLNLDEESPHIAISAGPGAGKTSMMALIIAFLVKNGVERIDVINTKRTGYSWCASLPGVYVHNTMQAQMDAIHNVRMRMESRYDALMTNDTLTFPRHVLIIEEQNSWMTYAKMYWDDIRNEMDSKERSSTPRRNPAIADIGFILFQGRQACVNVVSIYQRMSANAAGGGDMRDSYGAKLLSRSSPQAWKILVGTTPVPKDARTTIRGRGVFVLGDIAHSIQVAYLTQEQALEYALSGDATVNVTGPGSPQTAITSELYSLRELADTNVIPIKYGALRKARQRDKQFPPAARKGLYMPEQIRAWYNNRPSTKRTA